jgi:hypothetical protein
VHYPTFKKILPLRGITNKTVQIDPRDGEEMHGHALTAIRVKEKVIRRDEKLRTENLHSGRTKEADPQTEYGRANQ